MLNELQERWCSESRWDFSDLKALFLNCTLKRSPEMSHTDGLIRISRAIMEKTASRWRRSVPSIMTSQSASIPT